MVANISSIDMGEKFCYVNIRSQNPQDYAELAKDFADVMEDWMHQLVIDPNYVPATSEYRVARQSEVREAVRKQMQTKGFKAYGKTPASTRRVLDANVARLMGMNLSMTDLGDLISEI